jgi:hypothetical protein
MDRYPSYSRQPYAAAMATRSQRGTRVPSYKDSDIHDELGSVSGSDDGHYPAFHDVKHEGDHDRQSSFCSSTILTDADYYQTGLIKTSL